MGFGTFLDDLNYKQMYYKHCVQLFIKVPKPYYIESYMHILNIKYTCIESLSLMGVKLII